MRSYYWSVGPAQRPISANASFPPKAAATAFDPLRTLASVLYSQADADQAKGSKVSQPATIVTVCAALFSFGAAHVYINFFKPELWLKFRGDRGNQQYEERILNDQLFVGKCRTAGAFGIIFIIASAYGLLLNIPRLF